MQLRSEGVRGLLASGGALALGTLMPGAAGLVGGGIVGDLLQEAGKLGVGVGTNWLSQLRNAEWTRGGQESVGGGSHNPPTWGGIASFAPTMP